MRAFVTGATGFIGTVLVAKLRARGDGVVAFVRSARRGERLRALGCELVEGSVTSEDALRRGMEGCDAVFHLAGSYKVGIGLDERPAMYEINVRATEAVLDAAVAAGVTRTVYVSTIGAFGDTGGEVVDETYRRDPARGYVSYYDETKHLAHVVAEERIANGAPAVIVQPGAVYGPGDHSTVGAQLELAYRGKLRSLVLADVGLNFVHVDDVADGMLLAHDRGRLGEAYVLGGEVARLRDAIAVAARVGGHSPPRLEVPTAVLRTIAPIGPLVGRALGVPPNLRELVRASDGVTYWASDAKARRELGYAPRGLEQGLRDTFAIPAAA